MNVAQIERICPAGNLLGIKGAKIFQIKSIEVTKTS